MIQRKKARDLIPNSWPEMDAIAMNRDVEAGESSSKTSKIRKKENCGDKCKSTLAEVHHCGILGISCSKRTLGVIAAVTYVVALAIIYAALHAVLHTGS